MRPLFESRTEGEMGLLPILYSNRLSSQPLGGNLHSDGIELLEGVLCTCQS